MHHLPFLEALASATDTSDPVWRDVGGGYLVLRFFDYWLEEGPDVLADDPGLRTVRAQLRTAPEVAPGIRQILLATVNIMTGASTMNPALVSGTLVAYGRYLESTGRLALAAHVYGTVAEALDPPCDAAEVPNTVATFMRYGYVSQLLGRFEAATQAYIRAIAVAQQGGYLAGILQAQVSLANMTRARGNLVDAERLLDDTLVQARQAGLSHVASTARHARGAVRYARGRVREAIIDYYEAYLEAEDILEREVLLSDLAGCAAETGHRATARNAWWVLASTATNPVTRSYALVNLLDMAALDGDRSLFEWLRGELATWMLSAELRAYAAFYEAKGVERFGTRAEALEAYRRAAEQGARDRISHLEGQALERLAVLRAH